MRLFPLSPIFMLLCSAVGLSLFQILISEQSYSAFYILGQVPERSLLYIYLYFGISATIGYALGLPFLKGVNRGGQCSGGANDRLADHVLHFSVFSATVIAVSQHYMGAANIINIVSGAVSAQEIEEALKSSPFGIHGVKLLCGFYAVILARAVYLAGLRGWYAYVLHMIAVFVFLSTAKIGGMLFWFASVLTLREGGASSLLKAIFYVAVIACLFVVTRVVRNPNMELSSVWVFLLNFVVGLYLGSPVVNTNYVMANPDVGGSFVFLFSHFIPHKFLPITLLDLMKGFPDPTSPLGIVGAAYCFGGEFAVLVVGFFVGWLVRRLTPVGAADVSKYLFFPYLMVSCALAVMYQHFFNMTFFWLPLLMSVFVAKFLLNAE